MSEKQISVTLTQQHDYRFDIRFDDNMPVLTSDEPAPLGTGLGPSPVQLLCAAVGNDNAAGEYYLPDIIMLALADGDKAVVVETDPDELIGINSRAELAAAGGLLAYLEHVGQGKMPFLKVPVRREVQHYLLIDQATRDSLQTRMLLLGEAWNADRWRLTVRGLADR